MTLLGMELRTVNVVSPDGADQRAAVVDTRGDVRIAVRPRVIAVHEVEPLTRFTALEQGTCTGGFDVRPADVRDF